jgi:hypothetical protein
MRNNTNSTLEMLEIVALGLDNILEDDRKGTRSLRCLPHKRRLIPPPPQDPCDKSIKLFEQHF